MATFSNQILKGVPKPKQFTYGYRQRQEIQKKNPTQAHKKLQHVTCMILVVHIYKKLASLKLLCTVYCKHKCWQLPSLILNETEKLTKLFSDGGTQSCNT